MKKYKKPLQKQRNKQNPKPKQTKAPQKQNKTNQNPQSNKQKIPKQETPVWYLLLIH